MITITEALAELKLIDKKVDQKRKFIGQYLLRQEALKDPLEKDGGSVSAIVRERQAINDLLERKIAIRRGIQEANSSTRVTICGVERTISDWLTWRRDCAPALQGMLMGVATHINNTRNEAQRKGLTVVSGVAEKPTDIVVNVNEQEVANATEKMEEVLGILDGQLSLKNATITINV